MKLQKTECRKAERRWRKTKLKIHHDIYKEELFTYGLELKKARQSFFSDLINKNINNSRLLFSTIDRLTNPRMEIAPELISTQKCNEFALFFTEKILKIRQDINSSIPSLDPFPLQGQIINEANISEFVPVRHKTLEDIIFHLKTTTCSLDSLPTNFFKNVYCYIASDVLQIVNMPLHSGDFPKGFKTAVIKPLLKKNTLIH